MNIFNSLNTNTMTKLEMLSGPSYGLATAIVPPRTYAERVIQLLGPVNTDGT